MNSKLELNHQIIRVMRLGELYRNLTKKLKWELACFDGCGCVCACKVGGDDGCCDGDGEEDCGVEEEEEGEEDEEEEID